MSSTIEPTINGTTKLDHTLVDNVFLITFASFNLVLGIATGITSWPTVYVPDFGYVVGFYLVYLLMYSSFFARVFFESFGPCYVLGYTVLVNLTGFGVLLLLTIIFGKRTANKVARGNAIPLRNVQDFKYLVANREHLDNTNESVGISTAPINNIALTIPFQLAEYGWLHLYAHHKIVTGWIEKDDDILFTTIEYEGANLYSFVRGSTCFRRCKLYWSQMRFMAESLKERLNKKQFTCVIPTEASCVEYCRCPTCKPTKKLMELDNAKNLLWQDKYISPIQKQICGVSQPSIIEIKEMLETNTRETMNKNLFRFVAMQAASLIERDPIGWKLSFNNCEHLANYLMTGVERSKQLETAHFWQRVLVHSIGPLLEGFVSCRISLLFILHSVVFYLSASFAHTAYLYALCVPVAFTVEFCQAAWDISTLIGYEGSTRMGVVVVIQKILNSMFNGFAILLGIGLSHRQNKCLQGYWDEIITTTLLFLFVQCVLYPTYAIAFDRIAFDFGEIGSPSHSVGRFFSKLSVFVTIVMIPIFILLPFWFELSPMLQQ